MAENEVKQETTVAKVEVKSNNGVLMPQTLDEAVRLAKWYSASGLVPKSFDSPEKVFVGLQICYELGIPPLTGLRQIAVIKGTPALFGDLPLALVRRSKLLKKITETYYNKEGKEISTENQNLQDPVYRCICYAERFNGDDIETGTASFSIKEATEANLLVSDSWKKYPKDMLTYRARSRVLKSLFPDVLNGIAIKEYDYGMHETEVVEPKTSLVEGLREEILETKEDKE